MLNKLHEACDPVAVDLNWHR